MEHLFNCHGEWTMAFAAFASFQTFKNYWYAKSKCNHGDQNNDISSTK